MSRVVSKLSNKITTFGDDDKENLGLIHVVTGDGKGKTTSSIGLAVRASGSGMKTHIIQFLKSGRTGEVNALKKNSLINIEQYGQEALPERQETLQEYAEKKTKFNFVPDSDEKKAAARGMERARQVLKNEECDLLILDELNCIVSKGLVTEDEVKDVLSLRKNTEVVITGMSAPEEFKEVADYFTEVKKIKHPYDEGVIARKGIEY